MDHETLLNLNVPMTFFNSFDEMDCYLIQAYGMEKAQYITEEGNRWLWSRTNDDKEIVIFPVAIKHFLELMNLENN